MNTISLSNGYIFIDGELRKKNLLIEGAIIKNIYDSDIKGDKDFDCTGKWILPGVIDPHVHFRTPGGEHKEDWITGSRAALSGGVTTVFDMPNTNPPTTTIERLEEKRKIASSQSMINFGFYFGASDDNIDEIKKVKNIVGIKIYFGSTTGNLLVNKTNYLKEIFNNTNALLAFHAENEKLMQENLIKINQDNVPSSKLHGLIRDVEVARSAVEIILDIAQDFKNKIYFCHVSTQKEFELVQIAKKSHEVFCEVTPHHLFLNEDILNTIGFFGKVNPPLRHESDRKYLYDRLRNGQIDTIGTDHAPHSKEEKNLPYSKAPSGMPGLETILPLLLTEVQNNTLTIKDLVKLCSENACNIFKIKNKGKINLGYDADIIVINPNKNYLFTDEKIFTKVGWNPFSGKKMIGEIEKTFVLGNLGYDKGKFFSNHGKEVLLYS